MTNTLNNSPIAAFCVFLPRGSSTEHVKGLTLLTPNDLHTHWMPGLWQRMLFPLWASSHVLVVRGLAYHWCLTLYMIHVSWGGCSSSWFDRVLDITRWDRHQTTERHSTIPFTPAFLPFHRLIEQGHLVHGVGNQHLWACVSLRGACLKEQLPFMWDGRKALWCFHCKATYKTFLNQVISPLRSL